LRREDLLQRKILRLLNSRSGHTPSLPEQQVTGKLHVENL